MIDVSRSVWSINDYYKIIVGGKPDFEKYEIIKVIMLFILVHFVVLTHKMNNIGFLNISKLGKFYRFNRFWLFIVINAEFVR